jgi:hypothetical protein
VKKNKTRERWKGTEKQTNKQTKSSAVGENFAKAHT